MNIIARAIIALGRRGRAPDFIIGGIENPYLLRWWVIPRNRFFNIYLHQVVRDDDDRALHDHPWASCSIILAGGYNEVLLHPAPKPGRRKGAQPCLVRRFRAPGAILFRGARALHRLELPRGQHDPAYARPCWTLFLTGPRLRHWGFACEDGWVHWRDFTAADDSARIGPGCAGRVTPPRWRTGFAGDPGRLPYPEHPAGETRP